MRQAATDWLRRHYLASFIERYTRWLDAQATWPLDWQDVAGSSDYALRLSPADLAAFQAEFEALYERYRAGASPADAAAGGSADPGAEIVQVYLYTFPLRAESPMTALDARSARTRYLVLVGLRWLPTGLLIPVTVLLALSRGLSLTEIGLVFSLQGLVVLVLELPTGGLSDALGRRPVLILASLVGLASLGLLTIADSVVMFAASTMLQGVFRALDSGPLEAWYVDATLAADPDAEIEHGLSAGSTVLSLAIAVGALISGALVALDPVTAIAALVLPLLVALALDVVNLAAILVLMREVRAPRGVGAVAASVRAVPGIVGDGIGLLRGSRVLAALVAVELFWGFAMVTFESLFPIRLSETLGDTDQAAAIMGPVSSVAWFAAAAGAAGDRPAQPADRRGPLGGRPADRPGGDGRAHGPHRRPGSGRDRLPRLLRRPTAHRTRCT